MDRPKMSFCTTNYNCAHILRKHLDSIYGQLSEEEFEYIVVDNLSKDESLEILNDFAKRHRNMKVVSRKCSMGTGRQIAFSHSKGDYIVVVDTDTVYYPIMREFLDSYLNNYRDFAVQAIYCGIFPRGIWMQVDGRHDFNTGEDLEMWMRIWLLNKMKWCPVEMGENMKEERAMDSYDHFSSRYGKMEKLKRFIRREYDILRLRKYERYDLVSIWKSNQVDLGLGTLKDDWFGKRKAVSFFNWWAYAARTVVHILRE